MAHFKLSALVKNHRSWESTHFGQSSRKSSSKCSAPHNRQSLGAFCCPPPSSPSQSLLPLSSEGAAGHFFPRPAAQMAGWRANSQPHGPEALFLHDVPQLAQVGLGDDVIRLELQRPQVVGLRLRQPPIQVEDGAQIHQGRRILGERETKGMMEREKGEGLD